VYYLMRRSDEAAAQIAKPSSSTRTMPKAFSARLVQIQQHHYPEAIASLKRAIDLGAFYPRPLPGSHSRMPCR